MQKYNSRKEVPEKYKWDLTPFFKDEKEFDKVLNETKKKIEELLEQMKDMTIEEYNEHLK